MRNLDARSVGRFGRWAAGSALATANFASRAVHVGARTGAQTFASVASPLEAVVPGVGMARRLASMIDREATAGAQAAADRVTQNLDWMAGDGVTHGLANSETAPEEPGTARCVSWSELAADAALSPLNSLVASSLAVGVASVREVAGTWPGRVALDATLKRLGIEPSQDALRFEVDETRESFVVLSTDSGASAVQAMFDLADAAARLAFRDARPMHKVISEGIEEMRHLVDSAEMQELLPTPMVSEGLQQRARLIVERAPERFLRELEDDEDRPRITSILRASFADAENLRVFISVYPQVVTLIGTDVGKLLFAGSISFSEMEAFMEGRRSASDERNTKKLA